MAQTHFAATKRLEADSNVMVYAPSGQLNGHAECFEWLEDIRRDIQAGKSRGVLNLSDVARIDSTGLGILAAIHVSAVNAGGKLCITGLNPKLRLLFETTWLFKVLHVADNEAQAIEACALP